LIIATFGFLYSASSSVYAQQDSISSAEDDEKYKQKIESEANNIRKQIIDSGKAGYFTLEGKQLLQDNSKNPQIYGYYYKTDGKGTILKYATGANNKADDFLKIDGEGSSQMSDSLKTIFIKGSDGKIIETIDTNPDHTNDDLFVATALQKAGKISGEDQVSGTVNGIAKDADIATFDGGVTNFEKSQQTNANLGVKRDQQQDLTNEIAYLKEKLKDPNLSPAERAYHENDLKIAQENKAKIDKEANEIATQRKADVDANQPKPVVDFVGLDICANMLAQIFKIGRNEWNTKGCIASFVNIGIQGASLPFVWAANLLDYVITFTVTEFGDRFKKGGGLYESVNGIWILLKNISNLFFIGALIYIAVKTIIDADGFQEKTRLVNVLIFAVLINFSMFFTKVLIDVSNTASLQVLTVLQNSAGNQKGGNDITKIGNEAQKNIKNPEVAKEKSLSTVLIGNMKIQQFIKEGDGGINFKPLEPGYIITYGLFSIIFILVATVVIGVIGGMLIVRFVILVVLLMTSPIAYVGRFLPKVFSQYSEMWWEKLKGNLIFLPVLMIMFYISMTFTGFVSTAVLTNANNYTELILSFIMTIAMLILSISVAQSMGGSAGVASWGSKWARGIVGGATVGLAARTGRRAVGLTGFLAEKSGLGALARKGAASNSALGRMVGGGMLKAGKAANKATFDVRNTEAGKKVGLGDGLKGGYGDVNKAQETEHKAAIKAYKEDLKLSDKEQTEKAKSDPYSNARRDLEKAKGEEKDKIDKDMKELKTEEETAKASIEASKEKVSADMEAKFADERKKLLDQRKEFEDRMATADPATKEDYQKKINANKEQEIQLDARKTEVVDKEHQIRNSAQLKSFKEIGIRKASLTDREEKNNKAIETASAKVEAAKNTLRDKLGIDTNNQNTLDAMFKRNDDLKKQEKHYNDEFFKFLENGTTMGGVFNGRNDVIRKELLSQIKEKMKDKDTKDLQKLLREEMKRQKTADEGEGSEEKPKEKKPGE
jgi:hypothetical protein